MSKEEFVTNLVTSWDLGVWTRPGLDQWYSRLNSLKTRLDVEIAKISYKPGYRFKTTMLDATMLYLIIEVDTPDTDDPKKIFHLEFATSLDEWVIMSMLEDPEVLRRIVYAHIMDMEKHEVGEWLRFGDARPWYPHAPDPTREMIKKYLDRPKGGERTIETHDPGDGRERGGQDDTGGGGAAPVGGGPEGAQHQG